MLNTRGLEQLLNTPIQPNLVGEDAPVRQILDKEEGEGFTIEDVLALEELYKSRQGGQLTEAQAKRFQHTKALFERRAHHERFAAEKPEQFKEALRERAAALEMSPDDKAKLKSKVAAEFQTMSANMAVQHTATMQRFRDEPQVSVVWPSKPRPLIINRGGQPQVIQEPEEIRVSGVVFSFPVGKLVNIPRSIADMLERKKVQQAEQQARKNAMDASGAQGKLKHVEEAAKQWDETSAEIGSSDLNPFRTQDTGEHWPG